MITEMLTVLAAAAGMTTTQVAKMSISDQIALSKEYLSKEQTHRLELLNQVNAYRATVASLQSQLSYLTNSQASLISLAASPHGYGQRPRNVLDVPAGYLQFQRMWHTVIDLYMLGSTNGFTTNQVLKYLQRLNAFNFDSHPYDTDLETKVRTYLPKLTNLYSFNTMGNARKKLPDVISLDVLGYIDYDVFFNLFRDEPNLSTIQREEAQPDYSDRNYRTAKLLTVPGCLPTLWHWMGQQVLVTGKKATALEYFETREFNDLNAALPEVTRPILAYLQSIPNINDVIYHYMPVTNRTCFGWITPTAFDMTSHAVNIKRLIEVAWLPKA